MSFSAFIVYTCAGPHGPPRAPERRSDRDSDTGPDVPPTCRPPRAVCRPAPPPGGRGAGRPIRLDPRRRPAGAAPGARFIVFRRFYALLLSTIVRRGGRRESGFTPGIALRRLIDASDVRCAAPAPAGPAGTRARMRSAAKAGNVDAEPPPPSQIARPRPRVEPASHLSSTRHGDRHTRASTPTRWAMRLSQPVRTL